MRLPTLLAAMLLLGAGMLMGVAQARESAPPRPASVRVAPPEPDASDAPPRPDAPAYYSTEDVSFPLEEYPPYPSPAPASEGGFLDSTGELWWDFSKYDDANPGEDPPIPHYEPGHSFWDTVAYYDSAVEAVSDAAGPARKGGLRTTPSGRVTKGTPAAKQAAAAALKRQRKAAAKKKKAAARKRAAEKACTAKCPAAAGKRAVCGKNGKVYATVCGARCHKTKVASLCKGGPAKSCRCRKA